ncbi:MAG: hypothetical protein U9O65_05555 [Thermotogota bacterium]|nr:hypothetical protein [Thermotogota bacterium]
MSKTHIGEDLYVGTPDSPVQIADSSGNLFQTGTQVTATATELNLIDGVTSTTDELNQATDNSVQAAKVTPSSVITASAESIQTSVIRTGDIIKTTMVIDLTGLMSVGVGGDIIGKAGICYIGRVTTAINGVIFAGQVGCKIVPTTGDPDIDLYSATEATGAYDGAISDLTETALMTAGASHAIGTVKPFTALPAANGYLYLTTGGTTAGTYDAGTIIIEMWGTAS